MALSFPLALADFSELLRASDMTFDPDEAITYSETGGGEILTAELGEALWGGGVTLVPRKFLNNPGLSAKINALRRAGSSFLIGHPFARYPQADPTGQMLRGATPTVAALVGNRRELSIAGLPAWYQITAGDHLAIRFGASGAQRAYFEVVTGAPAVSGVAGPIEVGPLLPFGVQVGDAVELIRPALKAVMVPNSYRGPQLSVGQIAGPVSFSWRQTLG